MTDFGNTEKLSDGRFFPPTRPYAPSVVPPPVPRPVPPPDDVTPPPRPDNGIAAPVASRFRNTIDQYQDGIFKAAHFSGVYDNASIAILSSTPSSSVVVDRIAWHGRFTGSAYQTIITFNIYHEGGQSINDVEISFEEVNDPFPPAFMASELGKQAVAAYMSDKIKSKSKSASMLIGAINNMSTIKGALSEFLKFETNNLD